MTTATAPPDPLHSSSAPHTLWTTTNVAEAIPGVITPLGWSVWGAATERGMRRTFGAFGVLDAAEQAGPEGEQDRVISVFYGRPALRADFFLEMGDRLPGTSGGKAAEQLFSTVPDGYDSRPQRRYYPRVARRLPGVCLRAPSLVKEARAQTDAWWRRELDRLGRADLDAARRSFTAAAERFAENAFRHMIVTFSVVQPAFEQLEALLVAADLHGSPLISGAGDHEETRLLRDLWACSRRDLELEAFLRRHGYHGPGEGELGAKVWRENPAPLEQILVGYRSLGGRDSPLAREAVADGQRARDRRLLLARSRGLARARAELVLRLAERCIPLRGVGKVAFLQSLDVARAAARRTGSILASSGLLDAPDDVFLLTAEELTGRADESLREKAAERRSRRERYQRLELPVSWRGTPEPIAAEPELRGESIDGIGASPGVVEGRVRVVSEPDEIELEPGEILVAHTTDPSWAAIMLLSGGLVIDIGSPMCHAAVVARELGIPCVANTRAGTRLLRTGDVCRVDGGTGRIEILEPATRININPEGGCPR
jgi:pyruvate, water dikinase